LELCHSRASEPASCVLSTFQLSQFQECQTEGKVDIQEQGNAVKANAILAGKELSVTLKEQER
jgi:hypothetical protein